MTGFAPATCDVIDSRSGGWCEACNTRQAVERHHRRPRGSGGSKRADTNTAANCLHLCGVCHRLIESHRALAYLLGWLLSQNQSPDQQRVMYRGDWALLTDDGSAEPWRELVAA